MPDSKLTATLYNDPACPWGYSANPALRVIEWRYRDQLDWQLVLIGLSDDTSRYADMGFTPAAMAEYNPWFRDAFGMPFTLAPKSRLTASSPACRATIAARIANPGREFAVFRALQLANFNTSLLFDVEDQVREVLSSVPGIDADQIVSMLETAEVVTAYESDKARTRSAEGSPTHAQGKTGTDGDKVRYSAPSVVFEAADGRKLEAGGFQTVEAYDVVLANLDPTLTRHEAPENPAEILEHFEFGLTTQEVAAVMAPPLQPPNRSDTEAALLRLVGEGRAEYHPFGDDALWTVVGGPQPPRVAEHLEIAAA